MFTTELWAVPAAVVSGILLALLVRQYRRLTVDWMRASTLALVNRYGVARQQRDWNALPEPHPVSVSSTHPYAGDLDIVGKASLLQLLDTTGTTMGGERLAGWLLEPAALDEIPPRQEAVRELSTDLEWLQELQQRSLLGEIDDENTAEFLGWASTSGTRLPVLTWLARLSVLATLLVLAFSIARVIDSGWLIVPLGLQPVCLRRRCIARSARKWMPPWRMAAPFARMPDCWSYSIASNGRRRCCSRSTRRSRPMA